MHILMSTIFVLLVLPFLAFFLQTSHSATLVVDGVSLWKNPTVYVGDTVIFNHRHQYKLYIFRNEKAFNLCNLTEATLLSKPNLTSFTWHASRLGFFYFTFINSSQKTCQDSQKLPIKVSPQDAAPPPKNAFPELPPDAASGPASGGGFVPSTPTFPWPNLPREADGPARAPAASSPGAGVPFINSNPAIPLPIGEVDSATFRPLPTSGNDKQVMVGLHAVHNQLVLVYSVAIVLLL